MANLVTKRKKKLKQTNHTTIIAKLVSGSINFKLKQHQFMLKKNVDVKPRESRSSAPFPQFTFVLYTTSLETVTLC